MKQLENLIARIVDRVNISLREPALDVGPYARSAVPLEQFGRFYAFYGLTPHHPLHFSFNHSSLAGSYFLGKCTVDHSVLYKTDVRGDELKQKGDVFHSQGLQIPLHGDEEIRIKDSFLIKTLVHSNSHDPENPEEFLIQNTFSMHYANIHGSPMAGGFIGPFGTVDLTSCHDCVIGTFAYVQAGELAHRRLEDGEIWVHAPQHFDFHYTFPRAVLARYIRLEAGKAPEGIFMDFVETRKEDFQKVFDAPQGKPSVPVPAGASLSRFAVVKGKTELGENVLVSQRAYLDNATLGKGSNAQENCYLVDCRLAGMNITAHGGKVIHARLGAKVFVGFNAFLRGTPAAPLTVGPGCIVMPHTIVDVEEPLEIPPEHLLWGCVRDRKDLAAHSLPLARLESVNGEFEHGAMEFYGQGAAFVHAFRHRIEHILEANGAYFDGHKNRGHAQKVQHISFNTIQPYPEGKLRGLYPTIDIRP
jgi:carbonic anhydrase/acetyltransferase-like protein (isoleucine patch superfamily)